MLSSQTIRTSAGLALLAATVVVSFVGCGTEGSHSGPEKSGRSSPEESFDRILQQIKRRLEQGPQQSFTSAGLDPNSDEVTHFSYEDKVSGEITEPKEEGGIYKAKVIIKTVAVFIHRQTPSASGGAESKPPSDNSSILSILEEEAGQSPLGQDPLLVEELDLTAESSDPPSDTSTERTRTQASKKEETMESYDLEYRDGKWVLASKVEKESMELIFEYALADQ